MDFENLQQPTPATEKSAWSAPVDFIATDDSNKKPEQGIALCLSGGGYRSMLFHVGALVRLNELGQLPKIDRVSSVSGGSITAGVLGFKWKNLDFKNGVASNFEGEVITPIRRLAAKTIDIGSVLTGFIMGGAAERIAHEYRYYLFGNATLQELPDPKPRFVINATNVQSKALWRFSRPYMRDWRVGEIKNPNIELAVAVAASSAFPPVLSPLQLRLDAKLFTPGSGYDLQREPFTSDIVLTDGGVYDNLGLETAWKSYNTVWVSDAGGMYAPEEHLTPIGCAIPSVYLISWTIRCAACASASLSTPSRLKETTRERTGAFGRTSSSSTWQPR